MTYVKLRRTIAVAALLAMAIGGCGRAETPANGVGNAKPNPSSCGPTEGGAAAEIQRKTPLEIPPALSAIAAADIDHIGFVTASGSTLCVDTSWMEGASDMVLSSDGAFVTFKWLGYEEYGAKLVDLRGAGAAIETGETPVRAPSGGLVAALEYSESGFGSLNALGIWDIAAIPVREVAIAQFPEGYTGWRFDGWSGGTCIALSATTFENLADDGSGPDEALRDRFVSQADKGWQVEPAGKQGCVAP